MRLAPSRIALSLVTLGSMAIYTGQARAEWSGKGEAGVVIANGNTDR